MKLTVVIPTYKRPQTLLQALQSLQKQTYPEFEIIVIDNAVDRSIDRMINSFNKTARVFASYVPESRLGVHFARNTAAKMATGELLLYTDDDMTFDPGWVSAYANAFRDHPEMAASGGPVRPIWEQDPPQWLIEYIGQSKRFGILSLMEPFDSFQVGKNNYFYSCNMAIRKSILIERGGFHPEATGGLWIGDGEDGLYRDMWFAGDLIGYVQNALVYHHIPASRMTLIYLRKRMENQGAANVYTRFHYGISGNISLIFSVIKIFISNVPFRGAAIILRGHTSRIALIAQLRAAQASSEISHTINLIHNPHYRAMVLKQDWV